MALILNGSRDVEVSERGFYLTPMLSGLRLAGTSEFSSADHDEPPNWGRADQIHALFDSQPPTAAGAFGLGALAIRESSQVDPRPLRL